jgi:hypothetical protein
LANFRAISKDGNVSFLAANLAESWQELGVMLAESC